MAISWWTRLPRVVYGCHPITWPSLVNPITMVSKDFAHFIYSGIFHSIKLTVIFITDFRSAQKLVSLAIYRLPCLLRKSVSWNIPVLAASICFHSEKVGSGNSYSWSCSYCSLFHHPSNVSIFVTFFIRLLLSTADVMRMTYTSMAVLKFTHQPCQKATDPLSEFQIHTYLYMCISVCTFNCTQTYNFL